MLLCIDIGNTNLTFGIYDGDRLESSWRLVSNHEKTSDEYGLQIFHLMEISGITRDDLEDIILASVVPPLTDTIFQACEKYLGSSPIIIDALTPVGIQIKYDEPLNIGADRIVDAVAANQLYGSPAIIVDFGTATTFDAINENGDYLGGAIAPGIGIAAQALFEKTAKLPRVNLNIPASTIGKTTEHAMQSGLMFGYTSLVEGMVARIKSELSADANVIATGGLAQLIATQTDCIDFVDPWLTLAGLRIIYMQKKK